LAGSLSDRVETGGGRDDLVAVLKKVVGDEIDEIGLVVHDEDSDRFS
jgi:hypothetical protein